MKVNSRLIAEFRKYLEPDYSQYTINFYVKVARLSLMGKDTREINSYRFFHEFKERCFANGRPISTTKSYVMAIKAFLVFLFEKYEIRIIDLHRVKCKRPKDKPVEFLSLEEIALVDSYTPKDYYEKRSKMLFKFILHTGARPFEVSNILLSDVNFNTNEILIHGKGNKERKVFFTGCERELKGYITNRDSGYLFINKFGNKLVYRQIYRFLTTYGKAVGMERKLTPYILRKSYVTYLIQSGADLKTVQTLAGHDSIETTLRHYAGTSERIMREAQANFNRILTHSFVGSIIKAYHYVARKN